MKPPMWDRCEVPKGVVATVTMKNTRKATIRIVCNIGLQSIGTVSENVLLYCKSRGKGWSGYSPNP